ncbi:MAG TPA: hypothetical protein VFX35_02130 [Solirubrobacterales bacterium]|nr:hypothetical protein [Solirubrobacterales bacterium]
MPEREIARCRELHNMDDWLPKGKRTRATFFTVVVLLCAVLAIVRWAVLPLFGTSSGDPTEVIAELIGDFIATALAGTALALILQWLFPGPNRPPIVENVPAHEIGRRLEDALPSTRRWWYDGSTGRYQRSTTMPGLARFARSNGVSRELHIVILDPTDESLCRHYGNYRNGIAKADEEYSVDRVRIDIYATILAALEFNEREAVDITLGLKKTMSILRYDLSDQQLVITKESKTDPAIACPSDSFYYDAFLEQLRMNRKQARMLDLTQANVPTDGFNRESARSALVELGIATNSLDTDVVVDAIIQNATTPEQPYS